MFYASIFDLFGEKSPVPRVTQSPWLLISFVNILSDLARLLTMDNGDIISLKFDQFCHQHHCSQHRFFNFNDSNNIF